MNQYSDIRLSGTLITTAIVICGGLAVAVLIPVLRTHQQQPQPETRTPEIGSASGTAALQPLEQFPDEDYSGQSQLKSKTTEAQDNAIHRTSIAQLVARTDTSNIPAADQSREAPPLTAEHDGIHVPVNIHVDGSEFAEPLTRLANSVDDFFTMHGNTLAGLPVVTPITSAARSTDNAIPHENERLTQIDESLLKLSRDFDSLRTESRTAVRELAEDLNQTESAADLLDELRLALMEHRHLLADTTRSHISPVTRIAQQPGPVENPDSSERNDFLIPEPADTEQILPQSDSPENSDQRNDFEVPLPPEANERVSADINWETFVSGHHAENPERNDQTPRSPVLSKETRDMLTSEMPSRDTATAPVSGTHAKPLVVTKQVINSEAAPASPLLPVDDGFSPRESAAVLIPELSEAASSEAEPVVYEHTFNFVLPPATDPLPGVQHANAEKGASVDMRRPVAPAKPTTLRDTSPAVPQSSTGSRTLIHGEASQRPRRITRNHRSRTRLLPKFVFQKRGSSTRHTHHQPISQATHTQNEFSDDVSRRPHHESPEHDHQHRSGTSNFMSHPTVLHRLRSSVLAVGRKRTVD